MTFIIDNVNSSAGIEIHDSIYQLDESYLWWSKHEKHLIITSYLGGEWKVNTGLR